MNTVFTMESGTTYTLVDDHHFKIREKGGYTYAIKPWVWFAFDEKDPAAKGGVSGLLENAEQLKPLPGLRLFVYGREEWRISTRIKTIKETDE
jgi:hypothetical protein